MDFLWPIIGYLFGSVPSGVVVARLMGGADPRTGGSGNIGATNVLRTLGPKAAVLTLAGDVAKGVLPVVLARLFLGQESPWIFATAGAAILGHDFSFLLRFRGGKGVATTAGSLAALDPEVALLCLLVWIFVAVLTRYSSAGALAGAVLGPLIAWMTTRQIGLTAFCAGAGTLLIALHRENIRRLRNGTEKKLSFGSGSKSG